MILLGLGNPGTEYNNTRHNIGFMILDHIASKQNTGFKKENLCLTSSFFYKGTKVILAKPQTYMNLSGNAAQRLLAFYKIPVEEMIVIQDDLDLAFMTIKFQQDRGTGGHRGISHIHQMLNTSNYMRLKVGIGRPSHKNQEISDFVLQKFHSTEEKNVKLLLEKIEESLYFLLDEGFKKTASQFNGEVS